MVSTRTLSTTNRQIVAIAFAVIVLTSIVLVLYLVDRQGEWSLREQQSKHRLELASEIIERDIARVKSDLLFLTSQIELNDNESNVRREQTEIQFADFLETQQVYDQVRLISFEGDEIVRVQRSDDGPAAVKEQNLQNKAGRYYVKESLRLNPGEIFVSEFDLNQERGQVELPVNPVIRFVTPVVNSQGESICLLVFNYLGQSLLDELSRILLPGQTYLVNQEGGFLLGPSTEFDWGWILNHDRDFEYRFQDDWQRLDERCFLGQNGIFMAQKVDLDSAAVNNTKDIWVVSHIDRRQSFATSKQSASRLALLATLTLLPIWFLIRAWVFNRERQRIQNEVIAESEKRLRILSSKLVHLQEEERRAISRELHDQLGQQATAINVDLKLLKSQVEFDSTEQIDRVINESECLLRTIHDFSKRVRPVVLDDLGLHDALESHIWDFESRSNVECQFNSDIQGRDFPGEISENVFRLVQEALTNVTRHSEARNVWIGVNCDDSEETSVLKLSVADNGVGIMVSNGEGLDNSKRLGILGMRERVDLLDGEIDFQKRDDGGTQINIEIPVRTADGIVNQGNHHA